MVGVEFCFVVATLLFSELCIYLVLLLAPTAAESLLASIQRDCTFNA